MRLLVILGAVVGLLLFFGCDKDVVATDDNDDFPDSEYAGSEVCASCHDTIYQDYIKTGHNFKLHKIVDDTAPDYPFHDLPGPPAGSSWSDVAYVLGGYARKALFIGTDGYFITAGGQNEYFIETEEWHDWHADEEYGYGCASCHTTGYDPEGGNQGGLEGITGTWVMEGIQCEYCHGPGDEHVNDPTANPLLDRSSELCATCHASGSRYKIPARDGFIRSHAQYNENYNSPMGEFLACNDCHDPHKNVFYEGAGIKYDCSECHNEEQLTMTSLECNDCHMPELCMSTVGDPEIFDGDMVTHMWTINTDPDAEQFYTEDESEYSYPYITLDFACLVCHLNQDRQWAADNAVLVHNN